MLVVSEELKIWMCGEMCTSVACASFLAQGYVSSLYYTFMAGLDFCKKWSNNTSVKQLGKKKISGLYGGQENSRENKCIKAKQN